MSALFTLQRFATRSVAHRTSAALAILFKAPDTKIVRIGGSFSGTGSLVLDGAFYSEEAVQIKCSPGPIHLGDGVRLRQGVVIANNGSDAMRIGNRTNIGEYSVLLTRGKLTIGTDVMISPGCTIVAENHGAAASDVAYADQPMSALGISVGSNVWLGAHVTVLDGVSIGDGSIVAAGSTVMRDVAPSSLVAGNPARLIRKLAPESINYPTSPC